MKKPWTPQEVTFLIRERANGVRNAAIARELQRPLASVENKARHLVSAGHMSNASGTRGFLQTVNKYEPPEEPNFDGFLELQGDFISVSDVHVPFWKIELFERLFSVARKFKIKLLIINGDFLNMDAFSRWPTANKGRDHMETEFTKADYVLGKCLKVFDKIVITMGNHEERLFKSLLGQINPERFFKMLHTEISTTKHPKKNAKVQVSDYPYCIVNGKWLVGHPAGFSGRGGSMPADIADKYEMNVILGHNHQYGVQMSLSGKYQGIDQGMGADGLKVEYSQKSLNKYRTWQNGFTMVKNNYAYPFNLRFTDWDFWLK